MTTTERGGGEDDGWDCDGEGVVVDGVEMRPVPMAPGYFVTSDGRVFSTKIGGRLRERKCIPDQNGYLRVMFSFRGGHIVLKGVHQVVYVAFNGPPPVAGMVIRHLDSNRTNNTPANVAWGTPAANTRGMMDQRRHRAHVKPESYTPEASAKIGAAKKRYWDTHDKPTGSRNPFASLTERDVVLIRARLLTGAKHRDIAKSFGVSRSTVSLISQGKTWTHVGVDWKETGT